MDGDSKRQNKKSTLGNDSANAGDLLQPARVRCSICLYNEIDRFLLDYGFNFLPYFSILLYTILLIKEGF